MKQDAGTRKKWRIWKSIIYHVECFKSDGPWMCRACCQHLWNYKNIGHSFHHIDLWIACCYDPGSTSSVHPSSERPNYVFFEQILSISFPASQSHLSLEEKAIKVNILGLFSRSLNQFIEHVSCFFPLLHRRTYSKHITKHLVQWSARYGRHSFHL